MSDVQFILTLPEDLAEKAKSAGLLTNEAVIHFLEDALVQKRREAMRELIEDMRETHAIQPPLTQEEIDAELRAYYAEKAKARQDSNK